MVLQSLDWAQVFRYICHYVCVSLRYPNEGDIQLSDVTYIPVRLFQDLAVESPLILALLISALSSLAIAHSHRLKQGVAVRALPRKLGKVV